MRVYETLNEKGVTKYLEKPFIFLRKNNLDFNMGILDYCEV